MVCYLPRFVDKLYTIQPGENETYLPSPEALREKILVKVSDVNLFPLLEFYPRIPLQMLYCHSRSQSLRSFWTVVGIESSGLVQHRKSATHGLPVKSSKSDWLTMRKEYSAYAQKIGSRQSSRSQPQARRIVGSGDENAVM